jgi:hypothetical protein
LLKRHFPSWLLESKGQESATVEFHIPYHPICQLLFIYDSCVIDSGDTFVSREQRCTAQTTASRHCFWRYAVSVSGSVWHMRCETATTVSAPVQCLWGVCGASQPQRFTGVTSRRMPRKALNLGCRWRVRGFRSRSFPGERTQLLHGVHDSGKFIRVHFLCQGQGVACCG